MAVSGNLTRHPALITRLCSKALPSSGQIGQSCHRLALLIIFVVGLGLTSIGLADNQPAVYQIPDQNEFSINLAPVTDLHISDSDRLQLKNLQDNEHLFHGNAGQYLYFGPGDKTVWLRLTLTNPGAEARPLWLEFSNPLLNDITLYTAEDSQTVTLHSRQLQHHTVSRSRRLVHFPINIAANSQKTFYLEVQAGSELGSNLYLFSPRSYQIHRQLHDIEIGVFYGFMLSASLYFLVIYCRSRKTNVLFGSLLALATAVYLLVTDGALKLIDYQYPELTATAYPVSFGILLLTQLLFAGAYFNLKAVSPSLNTLLKGAVAAVIVAFITLIQDNAANSELLLLIATSVTVVIFCIAVLAISGGYQSAPTFMGGFLCQSLGTAAVILGTPDATNLGLYDLFKFVLCAQFFLYGWGLRRINWLVDEQITRQRTQEDAHKRWHQLADASFEAILIFKGSTIIEANSSCKELLGYQPDDLVNTSGKQFIASDHYAPTLDRIQSVAENPFEAEIRTRDGVTITAEIRCKPGTYDSDAVTIVAIRDISERKKYEHELRKLGHYDALTGLANRVLFRERLEHAISATARVGKQHALLFIDLDQFKTVNDSLGHDVGDELLIQVARRLSNSTRRENTVARLGGDEFAILLEDIQAPYVAARIAEQLLVELGKTVQIHGLNLVVTPSIGIAIYPQDGQTIGDLLKSADTAMYHAKNQGRNNYQFFTTDQNKRIIERIALESELRSALARNEFYLLYQPRLDIDSGRITGIEVLVRWLSPARGSLNPKEFITIAEETNLIRPIGEVILNKACQQARAWLDQGLRIPISINLSSSQFNQDNFSTELARSLDQAGVPAELLELEITEGAVTKDPQQAVTIMRELKQAGIKLAIDDFGVGYSSLNQLKRFPVDRLKIARTFIRDIESNPEDLSITSTIIGLAHSLNMKVVAEGVENSRQMNILKSLHCDELQGYLITHPVTASEIEQLLVTRPNLLGISRKTSGHN